MTTYVFVNWLLTRKSLVLFIFRCDLALDKSKRNSKSFLSHLPFLSMQQLLNLLVNIKPLQFPCAICCLLETPSTVPGIPFASEHQESLKPKLLRNFIKLPRKFVKLNLINPFFKI